MPLLINPLGADVFEVPKHAWVILWIAAAIMVTALTIVKKQVVVQHHRDISILLVPWLLSLTVSTALSPAPWESFLGSAERMQGVLAMILYIVHFLFCLSIFAEPRTQKVFFNLTIGIGAVLSGYAILQHFNLDPFDLADITDASGRAFATLGHPNFLGQWLIFPMMILASSLFCHFDHILSFRAESPQATKSRNLVFLFVLMLSALLTTLNRASMLGIGIAVALFFIINTKISWKKFLIATVMISIAALPTLASGVITNTSLRSIFSRSILIKSSIPLLREHPLFGSGPESFYQTIQPKLSRELYETEHMFTLPDRVHNELLQTLLDQGFFGLSLYLIMIGFLIWVVLNRRLRSPAANIAFYSIITTLISVQFSFSMTSHWVFLMAMWAILLNETVSLKTKTLMIRKPLAKAGVIAAGAAIGIALLIRSTTLVAADIFFDHSIQEAISEGRSNSLERAVNLNPWNREYLYHGISFLNVLPNPQQKIQVMEEFLKKLEKLTGKNFLYHLAAAEVEAVKGNVKNAEQHFVASSRQAPNWPYVDLLWGDFEYEHKGCDNAIPHYERLIELAPSYWNEPTGEKARIFRKGHQLFFDAVERLEECNKYK